MIMYYIASLAKLIWHFSSSFAKDSANPVCTPVRLTLIQSTFILKYIVKWIYIKWSITQPCNTHNRSPNRNFACYLRHLSFVLVWSLLSLYYREWNCHAKHITGCSLLTRAMQVVQPCPHAGPAQDPLTCWAVPAWEQGYRQLFTLFA